jgi:hypothetical protein
MEQKWGEVKWRGRKRLQKDTGITFN